MAKWIISVWPKRVAEKHPHCIRVQDGPDGKEEWASAVTIMGASRIVTNHEVPIPCGARVWIETNSEVNIER